MAIGAGLRVLGALGSAMAGGVAGIAGESMGLTDKTVALIEDAAFGAGMGGKINVATGAEIIGEWCKPQNTSRRILSVDENEYLHITDCAEGACNGAEARVAWVNADGGRLRYRMPGEDNWTQVWLERDEQSEIYFLPEAALAQQAGWTRCALLEDEPAEDAEPGAPLADDLVAAFAAVAGGSSPAADEGGFKVVVQAEGGRVNIRVGPTTRSPRLGYGENGDLLTASGLVNSPDNDAQWYAITTHSGRQAYIHADYAVKVDEAPKAQAVLGPPT